MSHHLRPALALSAGLALALSGCSAGLTRTAPAATSTYTPAIAGSGSGQLSTAGSLTASAPAAGGSAPADAPVAGVTGPTTALGGDTTPTPTPSAAPLAGIDFTRTAFGSDDVVHLRFDVVSLTRQGPLLQLAVRITSKDPVPTQRISVSNYLTWAVDGLSDTTRDKQLVPSSGISVAYSGTTLIDVAAKKRYLVAVDSSGNCLCTPDLYQNYSVGPGQSLTLNATYAAPPTTTTKMDVDVPGIGDFADVPIS
jgi:hypothetical protein